MSGSRDATVRILFVCLGNICRSPLAEGVLQHRLEEEGRGSSVEVDSAGTGAYHVGEAPDPRATEVARSHGIELTSRARQVQPRDLEEFDYVLAMDRANFRHLEEMQSRHGGRAALRLLRDYDPWAEGEEDREVPDPYYGGPDGFQEVFDMVWRSCGSLLEEVSASDPES